MADLLWPGDERAGELMSDSAYLQALLTVENAWLATLVDAGIAPAAAAADLRVLVGDGDIVTLAAGAERDGNPVTGLVGLLRRRTGADTARWLHRGLTSQDVVDSALMWCTSAVLHRLSAHVSRQVHALIALVERHRDAPVLAHTLTQPALPTTAGMRFVGWLTAVLDAADTLGSLPPLPVAMGGAAGTLAATVELSGSAPAALQMSDDLAARLDLAPASPWHTTRAIVTRVGDALVGCTDAWGHIANDVAIGCRAEIGEFSEGAGGGSSTMPHKNNPVATVLIRRAALAAPASAATLHAAAAASVDERADGGWHAEWATLRTLARRTVIAGSQTADLLAGLRFDAERAAANLAGVDGLLAEQQAMVELTGRPAAEHYRGATDILVARALQRGHTYLKEQS
jgi:3-carboxy-cis,cis-muconate cycloisomerase